MTGHLENRGAVIAGVAPGIGKGRAIRGTEEGARPIIADPEVEAPGNRARSGRRSLPVRTLAEKAAAG